MSRFLIIFLSVYSSMHAFFYWRARVLFPSRGPAKALAVVFLLLMIAAPLLTRQLERNGFDATARIMAYLGFCWMGFLFVAFWGLLLLLMAQVLTNVFQFAAGAKLPDFGGRWPTAMVLGLAGLICVYGFFEARSIRLERVTIKTSKLPANSRGLKIAQISDVHLGLIVRDDRLKSIFAKVRQEAPDLLVCTGDLVDGNIDRMDEVTNVINDVNPPLGKYAVTGNHELYAGLGRSLKLMERFGFQVLRGEMVSVQDLIQVAGVDDPVISGSDEEASLLRSGQSNRFTVLLKHRPEVDPASLGLFDLQLSGHTHRGQIFPFRFFIQQVYPLYDGLYELDKGSKIYTSRGSGTWGPPIRILSPPEVTIIEVKPSS